MCRIWTDLDPGDSWLVPCQVTLAAKIEPTWVRFVRAEEAKPAPWALNKTDPARMATVLYVLAETIRHLAVLAQPITPAGAGRILDQLAVDGAAARSCLGNSCAKEGCGVASCD